MKKITLLLLALFCLIPMIAQDSEEELNPEELKAYLEKIDSLEKTFTYQRGTIKLGNDLATINVPEGYKFLDSEQSKYVLTELWGNPPSETMGLLFPEETSPVSINFTYAVEITYSDEGYIDDDDAKDLDYDDLLQEIQDETKKENPERKKMGYPTIEVVGWASPPFYDSENKKLHWAKELKFEGYEVNTLNYNIRILGRHGFLNLNAIGDMDILPEVQKDVDKILASVEFNEGNRYADFNPDMDKVAAYGIGGLIAGKVLAKAGFFALILKAWKFIAVGLIGLFAAVRKKIFGKKE